MKLSIVGDESHKLQQLLVPYESSFSIDDANPEFVFAFGGDGTLMRAETVFPGVPKLLIRNSKIAKLATDHTNEEMLRAFFAGEYIVKEHTKLSVEVNGVVRARALNDVVVHNENPRHAIRYAIAINDAVLHDCIIGDGIVCATPLGSTGYYRSITDSYFGTGIGLAFNNSTEQTDHIVLPEDSVITLTILRGPGFCYADNQEASYALAEGDTVTIRAAKEGARIIRIRG